MADVCNVSVNDTHWDNHKHRLLVLLVGNYYEYYIKATR